MLFSGVGRSVVYTGQTTTKQGHEIVFGTNHLGPFLLTYLLLDLLKKSAPSHVINLSSLMHKYYHGKLIMKDGKIDGRPYDGSKLANVMHARELGKRFKGKAYHSGLSRFKHMFSVGIVCCSPRTILIYNTILLLFIASTITNSTTK